MRAGIERGRVAGERSEPVQDRQLAAKTANTHMRWRSYISMLPDKHSCHILYIYIIYLYIPYWTFLTSPLNTAKTANWRCKDE